MEQMTENKNLNFQITQLKNQVAQGKKVQNEQIKLEAFKQNMKSFKDRLQKSTTTHENLIYRDKESTPCSTSGAISQEAMILL